MGGSPAVDAVAVAALARRADRSLPLLPSGALRRVVLDRLVVNDAGRELALQLVAHAGLGFEPNSLWATEANPAAAARLFAVIYPGDFQLVDEGWQAVLPQLTQRQLAAQATLLRQRAAEWLKPLPGLTVVRNARVFDSVNAKLGAASAVYFFWGRITAVEPAGSRLPDALDTEIDAAGRRMLPGLFDMHHHAWRSNGGPHLTAGITTTRDLGNDNANLMPLMVEISAGQLAYPQVVPAGLIEGESPFSLRNGIVIATLADARAAVDWYARHRPALGPWHGGRLDADDLPIHWPARRQGAARAGRRVAPPAARRAAQRQDGVDEDTGCRHRPALPRPGGQDDRFCRPAGPGRRAPGGRHPQPARSGAAQ